MNGLMLKALGFAVILIIATIAVVTSLDIDIFADTVNTITIGGAIVIAVVTASVAVKYINQMKTDKAEGDLVDENWDGIGEFQNELPAGWAYTFLILFLWSMWYGFLGFPVFAYSQIGEYNEDVLDYKEKFEKMHKNADKDTLTEMGESIFLVQCAQCHGTTGDGLNGKAQNFMARFSKEQVLYTIENGSDYLKYPMGMMPPGMASGKDAEVIAEYIANGMKGTQPAAYATCGGCHGADGKGNGGMTPNLAEYDEKVVSSVLEHGKKGLLGKMPSFKTLLTPIQEKALTEYIQSLSK